MIPAIIDRNTTSTATTPTTASTAATRSPVPQGSAARTPRRKAAERALIGLSRHFTLDGDQLRRFGQLGEGASVRIFGVILAGGEGRRMGGADKALLVLAGEPLIARAVARLAPQVERLAISANGNAARFRSLGLPVLPDADRQGPLSGLLAGLHWAVQGGADALVTAPVDCPFFPPDLVPHLLLAAETGGALATSGGALHPTFGLWPVRLTGPLTDFLASGAKARVGDFARAHGMQPAAFPADGSFANLNTPDDLARAETLIRAQP